MKRFALAALFLSGCSHWCECQKQTQADTNQVADTAMTTTEDKVEQPIASDGYVLEDRTMKEATPVAAESQPSQLDRVMQDPNARPFLAYPAPAEKLQRKMLPSEIAAARSAQYGEAVAWAQYPTLTHSKVQLSDYAKQMVVKLAAFDALKGANVAVTSFVEFDESLQRSNPLGNQFAEALATVLPEFGAHVVDFKLTSKIHVRPDGDFSLSRDVRQLHQQVQMDYVLTGTLVTTKRGVQIHSRVVSVATQQVIAATTTLLPHSVLQQIQP